MYSMVLMMAMTAAPDAATCGKSYSCCGCYGSPVVYTGCTGCTGCTGYVASCHGGCHGNSCHGGLFGGLRKHGCHGGCTGCTGYSCTGWTCTGYSCGGGVIVPEGAPAPKTMPVPEKKGGVTSIPTPSLITVNVPAEATVTVDGVATTSTSAVRVFSTPELRSGTVYYYTFAAEVVKDGKTFRASERVAVETGLNPTVTLDPIATGSVASK